MIYYTIKGNMIDSISYDYKKLYNKFPSEKIYVSNNLDSIYIDKNSLKLYGS